MKVVSVNAKGGTGKTMMSQHVSNFLLGPDHKNYIIDGVNKGGNPKAILVLPQEFEQLSISLDAAGPDEHHWLDIGASQYESVVQTKFPEMQGFLQGIDYWLVPVTLLSQDDTISTIDELISFGIDPSRIVVVINQVNQRNVKSVDFDFAEIKSRMPELGVTLAPEFILERPIFATLTGSNMTVFDVEKQFEGRDLLAESKACTTAEERLVAAQNTRMSDASRAAANDLRKVFMNSPMKVTAQEQSSA